MSISRWFRRPHRPSEPYRPSLDILEDRITPVLYRTFPPVPAVPPATHLQVIVPQDVVTGQSFKVVIEAMDARNQLVTNYTKAVQITLTNPDTGASFPASFTFSAVDHGKHALTMTLKEIGAQTIKAASGTIAGQSALTVDGPVTHFAVHVPTSVIAGASFMVTVDALDANNHRVPGYTGTVHLTSTDPLAVLPTDYTFQASDQGSHVYYAVTLYTSAIHTLTVKDVRTGTSEGSAQVQVVAGWYNSMSSYGYGSYGLYNPYYSTVVGGWGYGWW